MFHKFSLLLNTEKIIPGKYKNQQVIDFTYPEYMLPDNKDKQKKIMIENFFTLVSCPKNFSKITNNNLC